MHVYACTFTDGDDDDKLASGGEGRGSTDVDGGYLDHGICPQLNLEMSGSGGARGGGGRVCTFFVCRERVGRVRAGVDGG